MITYKKALTAVATAGMAITCLLGGAGSAAAGTNGQKLYFHDVNPSRVTASVLVQGYNESGRWVTHCFNTNGDPWKALDGLWWVGQIAYADYPVVNCQGNRIYSGSAEVPVNQGSQDWTQIQGF
ncbi:hypothetical protein [Streptomyces sp. NPDC059161]|uniref:hypothetical protein n=1 Tax=unclassified Streptomyces TaxID=2593676 RepID=UPI00364AA6C1